MGKGELNIEKPKLIVPCGDVMLKIILFYLIKFQWSQYAFYLCFVMEPAYSFSCKRSKGFAMVYGK